jgi:hypothetical protein
MLPESLREGDGIEWIPPYWVRSARQTVTWEIYITTKALKPDWIKNVVEEANKKGIGKDCK